MKDNAFAFAPIHPKDLCHFTVASDIVYIDHPSEIRCDRHLGFEDIHLVIERVEVVQSDLPDMCVGIIR